jgi:uncharacterized protein
MRQILLLILLFFASSWVARKLRQAQARAGRDAGQGSGGAPGYGGAEAPRGNTQTLPEPMVRCAECGVHSPRADAIAAGGEYFCSAEHAQRHAARATDRDAR